ncbi:MAG: hypothetical protein Q3960_01215 [Lactobacillus sp.]|nr:hypothetical protein [Lactobacillus sp.]
MAEKRADYRKKHQRGNLLGKVKDAFSNEDSHGDEPLDVVDDFRNEKPRRRRQVNEDVSEDEVLRRPVTTEETKVKRYKRRLNTAIIVEIVLIILVLLILFKL